MKSLRLGLESIVDGVLCGGAHFPMMSLFDLFGFGALVVNGDFETLDRNASFDASLTHLDPKLSVNDFVKIVVRLFKINEDAGEGDGIGMPHRQCVMTNSAEGTPFAVICLPMASSRRDPIRVIAIRNLREVRAISSGTLQAAFGLTRAEAAVARRAAKGMSCPEIALEIGVANGTVRAQLKAVFAKTRTKRQSELAAVLARCTFLSQFEGLMSIGRFSSTLPQTNHNGGAEQTHVGRK